MTSSSMESLATAHLYSMLSSGEIDLTQAIPSVESLSSQVETFVEKNLASTDPKTAIILAAAAGTALAVVGIYEYAKIRVESWEEVKNEFKNEVEKSISFIPEHSSSDELETFFENYVHFFDGRVYARYAGLNKFTHKVLKGDKQIDKVAYCVASHHTFPMVANLPPVIGDGDLLDNERKLINITGSSCLPSLLQHIESEVGGLTPHTVEFYHRVNKTRFVAISSFNTLMSLQHQLNRDTSLTLSDFESAFHCEQFRAHLSALLDAKDKTSSFYGIKNLACKVEVRKFLNKIKKHVVSLERAYRHNAIHKISWGGLSQTAHGLLQEFNLSSDRLFFLEASKQINKKHIINPNHLIDLLIDLSQEIQHKDWVPFFQDSPSSSLSQVKSVFSKSVVHQLSPPSFINQIPSTVLDVIWRFSGQHETRRAEIIQAFRKHELLSESADLLDALNDCYLKPWKNFEEQFSEAYLLRWIALIVESDGIKLEQFHHHKPNSFSVNDQIIAINTTPLSHPQLRLDLIAHLNFGTKMQNIYMALVSAQYEFLKPLRVIDAVVSAAEKNSYLLLNEKLKIVIKVAIQDLKTKKDLLLQANKNVVNQEKKVDGLKEDHTNTKNKPNHVHADEFQETRSEIINKLGDVNSNIFKLRHAMDGLIEKTDSKIDSHAFLDGEQRDWLAHMKAIAGYAQYLFPKDDTLDTMLCELSHGVVKTLDPGQVQTPRVESLPEPSQTNVTPNTQGADNEHAPAVDSGDISSIFALNVWCSTGLKISGFVAAQGLSLFIFSHMGIFPPLVVPALVSLSYKELAVGALGTGLSYTPNLFKSCLSPVSTSDGSSSVQLRS